MSEVPGFIQKRLDEAMSRKQYRTLRLRKGLDFSSNDYLGFAQDLVLKEKIRRALQYEPGVLSGSTGSRLLRGHSEIFEELEATLSKFSSSHSSLFFPSGYQANLGLFSALLRPEDIVFSDEFNHASIIVGSSRVDLQACKLEYSIVSPK